MSGEERGRDARPADVPAGIAERCAGRVGIIAEGCAGRAGIIADVRDVDIAVGTGIADTGAAYMCARTSTPFRTAITIRTDHGGTMARHDVEGGIADACATGDTVTAITEVACGTMVAVHAK